ncbi:hypothetical protein JCM19231_2992 [Vibrio ishigakensis]|uniref:Uncharacterized protein n=1 Tax=Vibrio ishigakensis TaxID=1481914 RepID=A0A0B8NLQ7_9VIBR|nr:hypothetical protein JCM19231_2992 [Vibrio ishigakensis]
MTGLPAKTLGSFWKSVVTNKTWPGDKTYNGFRYHSNATQVDQ